MNAEVVALEEAVTDIKRNHKACSGTLACPCNGVPLLLQSVQSVGQTADSLSSLGHMNPDVHSGALLLMDLSKFLLEGGHSPLAALASAEAYYRWALCWAQSNCSTRQPSLC